MRRVLDSHVIHKPLSPKTGSMSPPSERTLRVIDRFKNHAASQDGYPGARRAAVLIPLFVNDEGELEVILTVRSKKLKSHPGEVALPGGVSFFQVSCIKNLVFLMTLVSHP